MTNFAALFIIWWSRQKLLTYTWWTKLSTLSLNRLQDFSGQRYAGYAYKPISSLLLSLLPTYKTRKQNSDRKQGIRKAFTVVHRGQFHQDAALSFGFSLWPHAQMISCHWESRCLVPRVGQLPCCQGSGLMGFQSMKASCPSKTAGNTWWVYNPVKEGKNTRILVSSSFQAIYWESKNTGSERRHRE